MFTLRVPASFDDTVQFLLKAYAQPLVCLYGSDMSDWVAERDFIIRVATSSVQEPEWPKWFMAIPMPQAGVMPKEKFGDEEDRRGRYAAYAGIDGRLLASGREPVEVMDSAVVAQWTTVVDPDANSDEEKIQLLNFDNVVKAVAGIVLYRLK
jgi:hypothetical protein